MKKVLVIDDSDLFREFIAQKLTGFGFDVAQAVNGFDGLMKMRSENPDLIIMDFYLSRNSSIEILEKKSQDPNRKIVPVIMASAKVDRESLVRVSQLGVKKFFTKPVKVDALVKAVADLLGVVLEIDSTPCIIDANYNDGILFIEVARGLNKDKIELLKYRLQELVQLYNLVNTKVLLLLTGLELSPNDSLGLMGLIGNITEFAKTSAKNIKILTSSAFVGQFLKSRPTLAAIEVVSSLEEAMDLLMGSRVDSYQDEELSSVGANFLSSAAAATVRTGDSSFNFRFEGENVPSGFDLSEVAASLKVAVVDDDMVIREILRKAFSTQKIAVQTFDDGLPFLASSDLANFDLVFLDLMMPDRDGFQVLTEMKSKNIQVPIIVLSALSKRETVVKAMSMGVKSYMIKPIQPELALRKAVEIIRLNF